MKGQQPPHKNVRVAYGSPKAVVVWSYPGKRTRSVYIEIETRDGEKIQVVAVLPR